MTKNRQKQCNSTYTDYTRDLRGQPHACAGLKKMVWVRGGRGYSLCGVGRVRIQHINSCAGRVKRGGPQSVCGMIEAMQKLYQNRRLYAVLSLCDYAKLIRC